MHIDRIINRAVNHAILNFLQQMRKINFKVFDLHEKVGEFFDRVPIDFRPFTVLEQWKNFRYRGHCE